MNYKLLLAPLFSTTLTGALAHGVHEFSVAVHHGETTFKGRLFLPNGAKETVPLVLVVHEWWGLNDYSMMRARKIANELHYAALAVDLYGNAKSVDTPDEALKLATPFYKNPRLGIDLIKAFVKSADSTSASIKFTNIAAIGYCFGGTQVLNLARNLGTLGDHKLAGVASFHGGITSTLKASSPVLPKILVLNGEADPMVKADEITAFKTEMTNAHADLKFISYPKALHAFTNPKATELGQKFKMPIAYDAHADEQSWTELTKFLKELF